MTSDEEEEENVEADNLVKFLRCMLDWDPDQRLSAKESLQLPWLDECRDSFEK